MSYFVSSLTADATIRNNLRFPTVLNQYVASSAVEADVILAIINYYNWTQIAIVQDRLSSTPVGTRMRSFELCRSTIEAIQANPRTLQYRLITLDSGRDLNFTSALIDAAKFSKSKNM